MKLGAEVVRNERNEVIATLFNVWIPNSTDNDSLNVCVEHHGKLIEIPLARSITAPEYWSVRLESQQGGLPGNQYWYKLCREGKEHRFADLAARAVDYTIRPNTLIIETMTCKGLIVDSDYPWQNLNFSCQRQELIIYQLHFAGFVKSSTTVSLIKQAEQLLTHIRNLNFTAIQLLPTQAFSNKNVTATGGYDPAYYFAPCKEYGTPQELREFVDKAHSLGLAVLFDVVFNHLPIHGNCFWQEPYRSAFVSQEETPWGRKPNFKHKEVRNFFLQNLLMYINEYQADGFRFDCPARILQSEDKDSQQAGQAFLTEISSKLSTIGSKSIHLITEQFIADKCPGFHAAMFKQGQQHFAQAYRKLITAIESGSSKLLSGLLAEIITATSQQVYVNYLLGAHDEYAQKNGGYFAELFKNKQLAKTLSMLSWCINVTLPGIPMLYMGTELLQSGYRGLGFTIDWEAKNELLSQDMQALVKDINDLRLHHSPLNSGSATILYQEDSVMAYLRSHAPENIMVVVNFANKPFNNYQLNLAQKINNSATKHAETITILKPGQQWCSFFCSQARKYGGSGFEKVNANYVTEDKTDKVNLSLDLPAYSLTLLYPKYSI